MASEPLSPPTDQAEAEAEALFLRTVTDLNAFLEAQPLAEQQILGILTKRLDGQADGKTWETLNASLASYLGREQGSLVTWAVEPGQPDRMAELEKHGVPAVVALLRTILGFYGPELLDAFEMSDRLPDDWRVVSREVYYDQITERHVLQLRIQKYNRQELKIGAGPSSLLFLISHMIRTVRLVGTREAFSEESIELFLDEVQQFHAVLQPSETTGSPGS